jgi:carbon storage regulator
MLVLTRKVDEEIVIGDDIVVKIVRVKGGSIRIGIEAPRNVRVMRSELTAAQRELVGAATSDA